MNRVPYDALLERSDGARFILLRVINVFHEQASNYKCSFCSDQLRPMRYDGWKRCLELLPVREYQCPHCFQVYLRPVESLDRRHMLSSLFRWRVSSGNQVHDEQRSKISTRQ